MTKTQTLSLIAFSAILALVGFQNCSKVGVQDMASAPNEKLFDDGLVADAPPADGNFSEIVPEIQLPEMPQAGVEEPAQPAPQQQEEPKENEPEKVPPVASQPQPSPAAPSEQEEPAKSSEETPVAQQPTPAEPSSPVPQDSGPRQPASNDDIDNISDSDAVAFCLNGEAKIGALKVFERLAPVSGPVVKDQHGPTAIVSDNLETVADMHSPLLIKGKTAAAHAQSVSDTHALLVICGMVIDELKDTHGHMILVNSTIKKMIDHDGGSIRSVNSEIQESIDNSTSSQSSESSESAELPKASKSSGKKKK